ncbi:hypothetical protein [Tautonia marina]|uniref:hypothetical protein n=1 Tax=Tautonia marina TaxID=2653855 RepID=UPI0012605813|nr:hypothetical protein [Tautonia marina]
MSMTRIASHGLLSAGRLAVWTAMMLVALLMLAVSAMAVMQEDTLSAVMALAIAAGCWFGFRAWMQSVVRAKLAAEAGPADLSRVTD